jgi:glucose-1-phosphate thymidylyltransferase
MEIAKALILAGRTPADGPWRTAIGAGHLFPVANRPILFHALESLRAASVLEAAVLADEETAEAIAAAVGDGQDWGLRVRYTEWDAATGVGGALAAAGSSFLVDEPVLVQEANALLHERMHGHIAVFARERLDALALRISQPRRERARKQTPGYLLSPRAVSILANGSDALANPLTRVREGGGKIRIQRVDGCLPCHADRDTLLDSNRRALESLDCAYEPSSLNESTVQGRVEIHATARVERSLLRGPVSIGAGARILDAYIGPYTSIGAGSVVEGTEIEHSIVLPDTTLRFVGTRLESCLIGRGARVTRGFQLPGAIQMTIGDGAEVTLR